jgi:hypothetical protein
MDESSHYFSRFAVVSEQAEAWALDDKFRLYAYDGTRFWRRRTHSTRYSIVPSWKAPADGWMHADGCGCHLCASESQEAARAA